MPLLPGKSKEVIGKNIETEIKTEAHETKP